jgi:hypothetical protein
LPGLGESPVSVHAPPGVVSEKFERSMVESAALLARHLEARGYWVFAKPGRRIEKRHARCVARLGEASTVANMENVTPPPGTPAKRALAALDNQPPAEPLPPRRISKKVRAAIDAILSGKCKRICDAAEHVGLARESLSRALSTLHVAEHLRQKVLPTVRRCQKYLSKARRD